MKKQLLVTLFAGLALTNVFADGNNSAQPNSNAPTMAVQPQATDNSGQMTQTTSSNAAAMPQQQPQQQPAQQQDQTGSQN